MKQTNNAITFLNASYQAVFKHAYVAGMASSVALLAASPYALAGTIDHTFASTTTEGTTTNVDLKTGDVTSGKFFTNTAALYSHDVTFTNTTSKDFIIDFNLGQDNNTYYNTNIGFDGTFTANYATVNINGKDNYSVSLTGKIFDNQPITGNLVFNGSQLNITGGTVEVNQASFSSGSINIGGLQGSSGDAKSDIYLNYSTLKTGIGNNISLPDTTTSLNGTVVNLSDYSAIDVNGKLTFDNGNITIKAKHDPTLDHSYGEISAKAIVRAEQFDLNTNSTVNVENDSNDAGGAIFANEFNLNNGSINVASGSTFQLAGKVSNPLITTDYGFRHTTFDSGVLNINSGSSKGAIVNSGNLTLGAINTTIEGYWGNTTQLTPTQYDVNQNAGLVKNYGTLNIGETPADESKVSGSGGTTYTLNNGSFINTNSGILNLNQNSKFIIKDGEFKSYSQINIEKNALLDFQKDAVADIGYATTNIAGDGVLSIASSAIQGPDKFYSPADGASINVASVDQLGKINLLSGGRLELKDGVFGALTNNSGKLSERINQALTQGSDDLNGTILFKDSTLFTYVDLKNFSYDFLETQTNLRGSGDAALITTGDINFKIDSASAMVEGLNSGSIGSLAGFSKIQGGNITIAGTDAGERVWLNTLTEKTIAATKSLQTIDGRTLAINNRAIVELSSDLVESTDSLTEGSNTIKTVGVDVDINSGGQLNVLAGHWTAQDIISKQGSRLSISAPELSLDTAAQNQNIVTQLSAANLTLDGAVYISGNASLIATNTLTLGANSSTVVSDQSSLSAVDLNLNNHLTLNNSTANVSNELKVTKGVVTGTGGSAFDLNDLTLDNGSTFSLENSSKLTLTRSFTTTGSGNKITLNGTDVELNAGNVLLSTDSVVAATNGSAITVKTLKTSGTDSTALAATDNAAQVTIDGSYLTIKGDGRSDSSDLSVNLTLKNDAKLDLGDALDTIGLQSSEEGFSLSSDYHKITAGKAHVAIYLGNTTANRTTLSIDDTITEKLLETLFNSYDEIYLDLKNAVDTEVENSTSVVDGDSFVAAGDIVNEEGNIDKNYSTDNSRETILQGVNTSSSINGGWRAVQTNSDTDSGVNVDADQSLVIHGNYSGNLIYNNKNEAVGANLANGAILTLKSSGNIGAITGSGSINIDENTNIKVVKTDGTTATDIAGVNLNNSGSLSAANISLSNNLYNSGTLNAADINVTNSLNNTGTLNAANIKSSKTLDNYGTLKATGTINVTTANLYDNSVLNAADFTATTLNGYKAEVNATNITVNNANLSGSTVETDIFTINNGNFTATAGADITVNDDFNVNSGSFNATDNAKVNIKDTLTVNGGSLSVDGGATLTAQKVNIKTGNIEVGSESSSTISGSTGKLVVDQLDLNGNNLILDPDFGQKTATAFVKSFTDLDSTTKEVASNVFALNGNIIVGRNSAVGIGGELTDFEKALAAHQDKNQSLKEHSIGALAFVNQANIALNNHKLIIGSEAISDLKDKAENDNNAIYIGQTSGLQIGTKAMNQVKAQEGTKVFSDLDSSDTIAAASGGTLIVPADVTADDIAKIFGTEVNLADGSIIQVRTENGGFTGTIDSVDDLHGSGDFVLSKSPELRNVLSKMTTPTFEFYEEHYSNLSTTSTGTEDDTVNRNTAYEYIVAAGSANGEGLALEQAARLGGFGAGVQVASQVNKASTDAIMQRTSLAANYGGANMSVADNGTSSMWLSSIYQDFSSEEFQADDLTYGADIDLYGVALGFDIAASQSFKLGAMFNAGKGDATGTGLGAGVANEFKYYGAGIYASIKPSDNFHLTADVTYTKVDNEISADAGIEDFGKLASTMDSSALSAGLTAEYNFNAGSLNIAPYAGIRYTRFDLEDYDVAVDGEYIATTKAESADVFSVPVGLNISSTIVSNDWVIKPSLDLNLTSNFGDKSLKSTTTFDQQNGEINHSTEFTDSFSYGAKAGLQIQNGNFSLGANVGYTKSSNTGELTAGANVKFAF